MKDFLKEKAQNTMISGILGAMGMPSWVFSFGKKWADIRGQYNDNDPSYQEMARYCKDQGLPSPDNYVSMLLKTKNY